VMGVDWIQMAKDRNHRGDPVNTVLYIHGQKNIKARNFLT
jgi:hypothetical protein